MLQLRGLANVAAPKHLISDQKHEDRVGLLFPFLNGGTYEDNFAQLMKGLPEDPAQSSQTAIKLMADAANGLARIHGLGLYHGDVKPKNLMVQKTEEQTGIITTGYIVDLDGLSKTSAYSKHYRTEKYSSPEDLNVESVSKTDYDWSKDDVWSLGMSFFEMLTQKDFQSTIKTPFLDEIWRLDLSEASEEQQAQFRAKIDTFLRTNLPAGLEHREEITNLICDMLTIDGTTRPLMAQVRDRLLGIRIPA
jgi:serine/threonine protein kinase